MWLRQQLDIFFGHSSDALTRVYARCPAPPDAPDAQLAGRIVGPYTRSGRTLAATVTFRPLDRGSTLLAEALVPDMCCWSPQQPHLYRVKMQLLQDQVELESAEREWGVRRLAPHGRQLYWNAQPWWLEAQRVEHSSSADELENDLEQWRQSGKTICLHEPDDQLCREASRAGVPLLAVARGSDAELISEIRRLAQWPAVIMALVDGRPAVSLRDEAPNLILAAWDDGGELPPWAQVLLQRQLGPPRDLPVVTVTAQDDNKRSAELAGRLLWH